jgi:hypothetical protein
MRATLDHDRTNPPVSQLVDDILYRQIPCGEHAYLQVALEDSIQQLTVLTGDHNYGCPMGLEYFFARKPFCASVILREGSHDPRASTSLRIVILQKLTCRWKAELSVKDDRSRLIVFRRARWRLRKPIN